uniref:DUF3050 domain-containing protein n=2 Tax=unclassified Candidatus Kentrum TaxID=2643149 RepID=A0A451ADR1_9GAMM|nr:MAG: Protein of unknown function (DUF3050) [Candidatus Kentron sp. LPFa]VFK64143.1 MAG: Protein of unknown function (DUF3050) [Candidatus Kentron sp. UNK]VFK69428.1 MAG: Protein of unknown function (DUF3050) [Candidatus Kentron sp. UNK]
MSRTIYLESKNISPEPKNMPLGPKTISLESIAPLQKQLDIHPVYAAVRNFTDLRIFMSHHIFPVWDFMSLLKFLQGELAPAGAPWSPVGNGTVRRFINDIVMEEESDKALSGPGEGDSYASHFELYAQALEEIGGSSETARDLSRLAPEKGFKGALAAVADMVPTPASQFMQKTFSFIDTGKPHVVAAAFALGREHIIPSMFRALLAKMNISEEQAPVFHYYLERHIHLDEDHHGPLSMLMLDELCGGDETRIAEAEEAAKSAIRARIVFWDGVLKALR